MTFGKSVPKGDLAGCLAMKASWTFASTGCELAAMTCWQP